ncbi:MAG: YceI family protein [Rhodospirillales bacterium]|nr:YceI family protein [Rhodospirillales bacterium]
MTALRAALAVVALVVGTISLPPPAAAAPAWIVDPAESRLGFVGTQMGAPFEGRFGRFDSDITFAPEELAASRVVVIIDMASAETGSRERDGLLPGRAWFDVAGSPQARFAAKSFRHLGGNRYEALADLTIRGNSKTVVVPVTIDIAGTTAKVEGATRINRIDFGVGEGEWASAAVVGHEVEVRFALTARRAP